MARIFDCCILFNELDMLETRLNILYDAVDYFIVCEAPETHSGQFKPLYLLNNWERFRVFWPKLILVNAGPLGVQERTAWEREYYHRSQIAEGLGSAAAGDWIIVADVDEIPNPDIVVTLRNSDLQAVKLELSMYYYDLNHRVREGWAVGAYRRWIESDPNKIRTCAGYNPAPILDAGWHFSYFGGAQQVISKVDAFMHSNDPVIRDLPRDVRYIQAKIAEGVDLYGRDLEIERVPLSADLPHYILDNLDKYQALGWLE